MSDIRKFFKLNKIDAAHVYIRATESLVDEEGCALEWEVRPISTAENEKLVAECTIRKQIPGKPGQFTETFDGALYTKKLCAKCTVFPDLYDAELQDSYGVTNPEDLLVEMLDRPGEYLAYGEAVSNVCGFGDTDSMSDKVEEAKNS